MRRPLPPARDNRGDLTAVDRHGANGSLVSGDTAGIGRRCKQARTGYPEITDHPLPCFRCDPLYQLARPR